MKILTALEQRLKPEYMNDIFTWAQIKNAVVEIEDFADQETSALRQRIEELERENEELKNRSLYTY